MTKRNQAPLAVRQVIPGYVQKLLTDRLGDQANTVLEEMAVVMLEQATPAPPLTGNTEGDFMQTYWLAGKDRRPGDALDFRIIEEMMKCGPVVFVMEMKLAAIMSIWRNERSWKIVSPDKELTEVVTANLKEILPLTALNFLRSSLTYGASFNELVWEYKTPYQLGLSNSRGASKEFAVSKVPNAVNPESVDHIMRTDDGSFNGFVQVPRYRLNPAEVIVERDQALVIPYRMMFRNLWGESYLKLMYPAWFWYEIALRSWVRYMERMGTPVAVAYAPSRAKVRKPGDNTLVDAMTWGLAIAGQIAKSNAAVLPSDTDPETRLPLWRLEYLTAEDRGTVFKDALEFLMRILVQSGMAADMAYTKPSGGTGSYKIGEIHNTQTQLHNELILIEHVAQMNQWWLPHFSRYNRGENGPPIRIETQGLDPIEREHLFKLAGIAGNSASFQDALMMIDWRELYMTNNIPVLTEKEMQKLKDELREEALKKQEEFIKVQAQAGGPPVAGEKMGSPDGKQKTPGAKAEEENAKKMEHLAHIIVDGHYDHFLLSDAEMERLLAIRESGLDVAIRTEGDNSTDPFDQTVKLFNPIHDKLGRFASKKGGGTSSAMAPKSKSAGGVSGEKAGKTGNLAIKIGAALGLAALGTVAFAALAGAAGAYAPASEEEQQDSLDSINNWAEGEREQVDKVLANTRQYETVDDAIADVIDSLQRSGFADIQDVNVKIGTPDNPLAIATYNSDDNTLTIPRKYMGAILAGDPEAIHLLMHEVAHSSQEIHRDPTPGEIAQMQEAAKMWGVSDEEYQKWWGDGAMGAFQSRETWSKASRWLEGQNELATMLALRDYYGTPVDNRIMSRAHWAFNGEKHPEFDTAYFEGGTGYGTETKRYSAMAEAYKQRTGTDYAEFIRESHDSGADFFYQRTILYTLFPEQMESLPKYDWPSSSQLDDWLEESYDIDNLKFYDENEQWQIQQAIYASITG